MSFISKQAHHLIFNFKYFKIKFNIDKKTNKILLKQTDGSYKKINHINGIKVKFYGKDSTIIVGRNIKFCDCKMELKDNCKISIEESPYIIKKLDINLCNKTNVSIGTNFACAGVHADLFDEENLNLIIGNDCMFSGGIIIRTSDGHSIYTTKDKKLINKGEDVYIGNHVWCGVNSLILKGTYIADNSIIGASSLINKKFDQENTIIGGSPAKVLKTQINWDRKAPDKYIMEGA